MQEGGPGPNQENWQNGKNFLPPYGDVRGKIHDREVLLDAVTFVDCGAMIGSNFVGGNGGLISRDTIRRAEEPRQVFLRHEPEESR